jgi:exosortase A
MTARTLATVDLAAPWRGLRPAVPALLIGLCLLGLMFHTEVTAAVAVWDSSTAYSHCFFIIPIALYLAWDRRDGIAGIAVQPASILALAALPIGLGWLVAERLGVMEGRQLMVMSLVELLFLCVLGRRLFWALSAPLLYLYFLVPFGYFVTPMLQRFTARFVPVGLDLLGIPYYIDAYLIEIPEGRFYIAEACAGLRFLIASIAFGVLYALLIYRSPLRRLAFLGASIVIPIVANGLRALGIVVLGHVLGSAQAAATDHILYGWLFFSLVIMLLILAGLPFREDVEPPPRPTVVAASGAAAPAIARLLTPSLLLVLLAAVPLLLTGLLDATAGRAAATPAIDFAVPPGCATIADAQTSRLPAGTETRQFSCAGRTLAVTVQAFGAHANAGAIVTAMRRITGGFENGDSESGTLAVPEIEPARWQTLHLIGPEHFTASAVWVGGAPARGGFAERLRLAHDSIVGTDHAPVLVAVTTDAREDSAVVAQAEAAIRMFLAGQTQLSAQIVRLSGAVAGPAGR